MPSRDKESFFKDKSLNGKTTKVDVLGGRYLGNYTTSNIYLSFSKGNIHLKLFILQNSNDARLVFQDDSLLS